MSKRRGYQRLYNKLPSGASLFNFLEFRRSSVKATLKSVSPKCLRKGRIRVIQIHVIPPNVTKEDIILISVELGLGLGLTLTLTLRNHPVNDSNDDRVTDMDTCTIIY